MVTDRWWQAARCVEVGADLFFPAKGQSVREAKRVCAGCPVRTQCLADALSEDLEFGIFGGFGRPARIGLRRPVSHGVPAVVVAARAIAQDNRRHPWI